jgi:CHAT domain-containing protein
MRKEIAWFGVAIGVWVTILLPKRLPAQQPAAILEHVAQAERLVDEGHFVAALREAKTAGAQLSSWPAAPDSLKARVWLATGRSYKMLARSTAANAALDSALASAGGNLPEMYHAIMLVRGNAIQLQNALDYFESGATRKETLLAEAFLVTGARQLGAGPDSGTLSLFRKALSLLEHNGRKVSASAARAHQYIGYYYWKQSAQFSTAVAAFLEAERIYLQIGGQESNYLAPLYVNLGGCYDDMGFPARALDLYRKALDNFTAQDKALAEIEGRYEPYPLLYRIFNNVGNSHGDLGEYTLAIRYLEKAKDLAPQKGKYWNNLGDAYLGKEDLDNAERCFLEALESLPASDSPALARPYHNLGIIYRKKGLVDKSLDFELRSLPFRKSDKRNDLDVARSYMGVGECYLAKKEFQTALRYLDSALVLQKQKIPAGLYAETASVYLLKAQCRAGQSNFSAAQGLVDSALLACGFKTGRYDEVLSPPQLLESLGYKGELYYLQYRNSGSEDYLNASLQQYNEAAAAIRHFRNTLLESESKATISYQFRTIWNGGIRAAVGMYHNKPQEHRWFDQAFALAEQSRSLTLLEGVHASGATKFEGIPDSVLNRERALKRAIAETEIVLKNYPGKGVSPGHPDFIKARERLFAQQGEFEAFQRDLRTGPFAEYYRFRYGVSMASPADIQQAVLLPGQTLLEYFVGDSSMYAFIIKRDTCFLKRLPRDFSLDDQVAQLQTGLFGYHTAKNKTDALRLSATNAYIESAGILYQKLIGPVAGMLDSVVVVVPDGVMGYIPFEALLTGPVAHKNRFHLYPYFGNLYHVSYAYSATLLREMRDKKHEPPAAVPFMGFAPFYFDGELRLAEESAKTESTLRNTLDTLRFSGAEVYRIAGMMKGRAYYGARADKARFYAEAKTARILHLSTHGVADNREGDFSYLVFAGTHGGDSLYVKDMYALALKAELVVLSACETGTGALQRGEGVISLARAFAYAGAKSIVTTLWSVNDASSRDLMVDFYTNMLTGQPKNLALGYAKRGYIRLHHDKAHPFYWAGFVGVGDMDPIR